MSRRCFGLLVALLVATAAQGREKPALLKVGIIGLDTSHVVAFTGLLNKDNTGPLENIRVVAAFPAGSPDLPISADRLAGFTKTLREKHGVEIVGSIEELLTKVDAVLLESVDGRPHLEQVRPVLAAKKPVFIDKPIAASLADTIAIFKLAKKHNVPCFSSSSLRFSERLQGLAKEVGAVKRCDTTGPVSPLKGHPELFFYGIHGIEMLFTVLGPGCESVTWKDGVVTGVWKDGRVGTFRAAKGYTATVTGDKGTAKSDGGNYQGLVREIGTFFRTGKPPVPADETINLVAFMVAAEESKKAGGKPVTIDSVMKSAREEIGRKTALDDYVAKPDSNYSWKLVNTIPGNGVTTYVLDLKSQSWRAAPEVDRAVWQHWLVIVKPDKVTHDTAYLRIGSGRNGGAAPSQPSPQSVLLAKGTGTVVADLSMVPNQPLVFNQDGKPRSEDDLIAYCHIKFMDTGDTTWLPRLPMVKSAVRAMDAVTEFLASQEGGKTAVKKYVVAGGSKRGWTTWLTGVVDPRVKAIVPIVIDVVNVKACKMNHFASYGFWAEAVGDYTRHKIHERFDTPGYAKLLEIIDPYSYRDRLKMPKYIVNSSGDQYFPPDSSKFYYDDLQSPKYLRYVPNTNHSLAGSDAGDSILAFYRAVLKDSPLPKFAWKVQPDGSIRVESETKPIEVNLWQATNPKARDFRLLTIGKAYTKSPLKGDGKGIYVAKVDKPAAGWTAFFAELVFDSGDDKAPYKFTTQVQIVPDVLPHSFEDFRKTIK